MSNKTKKFGDPRKRTVNLYEIVKTGFNSLSFKLRMFYYLCRMLMKMDKIKESIFKKTNTRPNGKREQIFTKILTSENGKELIYQVKIIDKMVIIFNPDGTIDEGWSKKCPTLNECYGYLDLIWGIVGN